MAIALCRYNPWGKFDAPDRVHGIHVKRIQQQQQQKTHRTDGQ